MIMSVNLGTVQRWGRERDSLNEWLRYDVKEGKVTRIFCSLCTKHQERLRGLRNYSVSFVQGILGTALKKDNVSKHSNSDMHRKACDLERRPAITLSQIYSTTPIGRAMASASSEEVKRVSKLFDIAYVVAREELPFTKYPPLMELERRHGVPVGKTYATEHKCKEFTMLIGETF